MLGCRVVKAQLPTRAREFVRARRSVDFPALGNPTSPTSANNLSSNSSCIETAFSPLSKSIAGPLSKSLAGPLERAVSLVKDALHEAVVEPVRETRGAVAEIVAKVHDVVLPPPVREAYGSLYAWWTRERAGRAAAGALPRRETDAVVVGGEIGSF